MSSSLKCPRCKNKINIDDTFCRKCGNPVKSDIVSKTKMGEISEIIDEEKIEKKEIKNENDELINKNENNSNRINKVLIIILLIVIMLLSSIVFYFLFIKKEKECKTCECNPEIKYVEKEPTIQYINYEGYRFSIPLDWSFEGKDSLYKFINKEENAYNKKVLSYIFDIFEDAEKEFPDEFKIIKK